MSTTEVLRAGLEAKVDRLGDWLAFWTFVVVVGLLLEAIAELFEHSSHKFWALHRTDCAYWIAWYSKVGLLLVMAGVCGELYMEAQLPNAEGKLRAFNNELVARAQQEASDANERARHLETSNIKLEGQLSRQAFSARAENLRLEAKELDAETKLEQERASRLKLQAQVAPRDLSVDAQKALMEDCRLFQGDKVSITTYALDVESGVLGQELAGALGSSGAGLPVNSNIGGVMPLGGFALGVHIHSSFPLRILASKISALLNANGILTSIDSVNEKTDVVDILIGAKPPANIIIPGPKGIIRPGASSRF